MFSFFFFFNDTATTEIYTLSLHDALPISATHHRARAPTPSARRSRWSFRIGGFRPPDRKSTRLNSSHLVISYAVFCLKKKKKKQTGTIRFVHYTTDCFVPSSKLASYRLLL